jgi:hypothetical protein
MKEDICLQMQKFAPYITGHSLGGCGGVCVLDTIYIQALKITISCLSAIS